MTKDVASVDTESPAFQAALQAAVDKAMGPIMEGLAKVHPATAAPGAPTQDAMGFMQQLAVAIAQLSSQGSDRVVIDPAIVQARKEAHNRMGEAILRIREEVARGVTPRPKYRVIAKVYLSERLIEPFYVDEAKQIREREILWLGAPNEAMRPANEPAEEIFKHFQDSIGNLDKTLEAQRAWVTSSGVVVVGEGPAKRMVGGNAPEVDDDGLEIVRERNPHDPRSREVNVLGTIAAPARQNSAGTTSYQGG